MMDGKSIRKKLIGNEEQRAVSPVIGVILMVAITVILAAVIAAFVLDMGQGQSANPAAGFTWDQQPSASNSSAIDVTATLNNIDRADSFMAQMSGSPGCSQSGSISSVGDKVTWSGCTSSGTLQIIAEYEGQEAVVAEEEIEP